LPTFALSFTQSVSVAPASAFMVIFGWEALVLFGGAVVARNEPAVLQFHDTSLPELFTHWMEFGRVVLVLDLYSVTWHGL
jgi:hypothetical protein